MNKNLESEYQNMIRAEVPDIWDKIEAKIDAQEAQKKIVPVTREAQSKIVPIKKKSSRWKYYVIPAAAALLCVAIAVPVLFNAGKSGATATSNATADSAMPAAVAGGNYKGESNYSTAAADSSMGDVESCDEMSYAEETCNEAADYEEAESLGMNDNREKTQGQASYGDTSFLVGPQATGERADDSGEDMADDETEESLKGTVFTMITGGGIPRELIEKAVQALGLKISEYDPAQNLYKIASDYELDEDTIKDIAKKLMESGFVKELILGD